MNTKKSIKTAFIFSLLALTSINFSYASSVNLIIDDLGYNYKLDKKFIDLPYKNISYSFLPDAPHTTQLAKYAHAKGKTILIHMPMQAQGRASEEKSTLKVDMSESEIIRLLDYAYARVPHAKGLNGHQGSLFSADKHSMQIVARWIKQKKLYWVDSRTSVETLAAKTAQEFGIPNISRDIFLDHQIKVSFIETSLKRLKNISKKFGNALAIGHPHEITLGVLERNLAKLSQQNIYIAKLETSVKNIDKNLWANYYTGKTNYIASSFSPKLRRTNGNQNATSQSYATNTYVEFNDFTAKYKGIRSPAYIGKNSDAYYYTTPYEMPDNLVEPLNYKIYHTKSNKFATQSYTASVASKTNNFEQQQNNYVENLPTQTSKTNNINTGNINRPKLPYSPESQDAMYMNRQIWTPTRKRID